ncbi:MAG TPA: MFS transporter [Rhizomicrobium sp.]|nr:MFS transporter [Rhizomicrobium sp.]
MSDAAEILEEFKDDDPSFDPGAVSDAALPTLLAVMLINLLGFGIVVPLLPFYGKSFQAAPWQIALVFSAYAIGAFFGEPFWGRLSDRIGRKPILISSVTGNCLCYLALAFAPNVYVAFFVRLLGGMTSGNGAVIQGYIADVTPPDDRSRKMSWLGAAYNIGFILGPAVGGLLSHPEAGHAGFRLPLIVCACLSFVCALGITLFVRESRARHARFGHQPNRWAVVGSALSHPAIGRLMLITFLAGSAFNAIEYIFPLWTQARFGWGPRQVGAAFAVVGVVAAINQIFVTGALSRRFGEAPMLAVGMALSAVFTAMQALSTGALAIVAFLALNAFGQSVAWPNVSALISREVDHTQQGQYLGLNNACGALARLTGPYCAGLIFAGIGVNAPFYASGLAVLPAVLFALAAGRRRKSPGSLL